MSTIRVDRITPYQSGSVAIEGLNITNLTIDGTLTASLQQGYVWVGNTSGRTTAVSTGSFGGGGGGSDITALNSFTASQQALNTTFADTGSNLFIGNQEITGSILMSGSRFQAKVAWPEQDSEYNLFEPEPFTIEVLSSGSRTYGYNGIALEHYNDELYDTYHNSIDFYFYSSSNFADSTNFGSELNVGPLHTFFRMHPSGANLVTSENMGNISLNDLQDTRTRANIYATEVHLGAFRGDILLIGNTGSLNVVRGRTEQSGSLSVSGSTTIVGNMVLTGSLTISGSSTFRNIGPTILSGSVDISGSINSDGYELAASSTSTIPALNSTFNLDLSGSGEYGGDNYIKKALVLGDGKVLVAGRFQSIGGHTTNDIARLNSNGTIDTSFSSPIFGDQFGEYYGYINTFVTQSDGKIVVGGTFDQVSGSNRRGLARLNSDGTLDTSFVTQSWGSFGEVRDIAIQNDDKIVIVGYFTSGSRRFNTDGTPDTSFNMNQGNNQPWYFNNEYFYSVALLDSGSDQAVLIGGSFSQWGSYSDYNHLVKLNPNGTLDFGFGGTNLDILWSSDGYTAGDRIEKIKVGDDGYIYVAGRFKDTGIGNHAGFGRVTTLDEGFGVGALDNGFRTYISGAYVEDFDFYDGDKILLGGSFTVFGNPGFSTTSANRFVIIDQNDGGLVSNWSTDGLASKYNLNTGSVNSVTLLPSDNVLVGGTFTSASFPSTAREGLASLKLTGFGDVTTTIDYSITADTTQLLISSSNTYFSGDITASTISGSFVGDGSGLTNLVLPSGVVSGSSQLTSSLDSRYLNVSGEGTISGSFTGSFVGDGSGLTNLTLPTGLLSSSETNFTDFSQSVDNRIDSLVTGTGFATTGSNTFVGNQQITGSLRITGSVNQNSGFENGNIIIESGSISLGTSRTFAPNSIVTGDSFIGTYGEFSIVTGFKNRTNYDATAVFGAHNTSSNSGQTIVGIASKLDSNIGQCAFVIGNGTDVDNRSNLLVAQGNKVEISGSIVVSGSISQIGVGGVGNIFIGEEPSTNLTAEAQYNVIIGQDAGLLNSSGSLNVFIGKSAGLLNQIGNSNVLIGGYAGYNTKNSNNVIIGESAGYQNIMGQSNVFIGQQSGYNNKVSDNTFVGYQAGFDNTSGSGNTFVGRGSGENNTTANNNAFFGYNSGRDNSVGQNNTFLGNFTGQTNTSGSYNTFVGSSAGQNHKTAVYNTFVGMNAGLNTGVGNENTFLGYQAGGNNLSGSQNTLLGANANGLSTFSNYVTAVGYGAAYGVTTGSNSVYLGNAAGRYLSDGMTNMTSNTNSVFIGTDSKSNLNAQDNQIVIGYNAISNGTNTVTIGNNDITDTYVKGVLRASTAILAQVSSSYNFADDTAAQAGGVPLGGLYHTSGSVKIRLV
jgi:uncharacterized delta-60 repeat protein